MIRRPSAYSGWTAFSTLALACASGGRTGSNPPPAALTATTTFVTVLGSDTVSIEQFTRTATTVTGDLVEREPTVVHSHYVIGLRPDRTPESVVLSRRRPDGSLLPNNPRSTRLTLLADSIVAEEVFPDSVAIRRRAGKAAYPVLGSAIGFYEIFLARPRPAGIDTATIITTAIRSPGGRPYPIRFYGADSARIRLEVVRGDQVLRFDREGRVHTFDGTRTTIKEFSRRTGPVDFPAVVRAFAAREAAGQLVANRVGRDTVTATVGIAKLWVDYGRPYLRGREVFRNGVLGDTIWRAGANAATQFETSVPLTIGGETIPAGRYTLWVRVPSDNSAYTLIVNKRIRIWGTQYTRAEDLVRVPMAVRRNGMSAEQFTIVVEPNGAGGNLVMRWGTTELVAPLVVP
ncbi:MAG: DUF2911 domain-containing protein [Gemmatimonadales bacterium]|nr:DUF2911 domain-containing protein [Gemmatimonadales bacterium]